MAGVGGVPRDHITEEKHECCASTSSVEFPVEFRWVSASVSMERERVAGVCARLPWRRVK